MEALDGIVDTWVGPAAGASTSDDLDGPLPDPEALLAAMDRGGVELALVAVSADGTGAGMRCVREHPDRFAACLEPDPNDGLDAIRQVRRLHDDVGLAALSASPSLRIPAVPIDAPLMYPLYALCCELDLPIFCAAGVPEARVPAAPQHVERIDRVMYDFPDLTFVARHGCEPWEDLMVKLMLKWPGLHYSTSALAPDRYPSAIIDYANRRGPDKVLYGGPAPMGSALAHSGEALRSVPFADDVWPRFLRENATRVLRLD